MGSVQNQSETEISCWDGTLTSTEFRMAASTFAERWNKFNSAFPHCSWIPSPNPPWLSYNSQIDGYLSVEDVIISKDCFQEGNDEVVKEELGCSDSDECIDTAMLVQNPSYSGHFYDFHIVYSTSYRVPVLYFRGRCSDGQPLALDDIEEDFPVYNAEVLKDSKWTFITQEYHPYLNRPWYTLHPCGTSDWMKLLFTNKHSLDQSGVQITKYLVSWFSVVGQVFGLKIPFEMLDSSA